MTMHLWARTHNPFMGATRPLSIQPVADDSPVGQLFEHPQLVKIELHYDNGTSTYWRQQPTED